MTLSSAYYETRADRRRQIQTVASRALPSEVQFGGEWGKRFSQAEVDALVGQARELGINPIDTAECYGDHLAESLIGRAVAGRRDRSSSTASRTD